MKKIAIFGAKSIALGACLAIQKLYKNVEVVGFFVSDKSGNPDTLAGLPVIEIKTFADKDVCVLIATPQDVQDTVASVLNECGFSDYVCIDSRVESKLMEQYYTSIGVFKSLHAL